MKLITKLIAIILACSTLQACSGPGGMNKQGSGALLGGLAGGLLGAQFGKGTGALAATAGGVLAGAFIGGTIGANMDETDKRLAALSSQKALETAPSGSSVAWRNPDNNHQGYIMPQKTFKNNNGQYCREYTQVVTIGGKQQKAYGQACRQADGQWEIMQ